MVTTVVPLSKETSPCLVPTVFAFAQALSNLPTTYIFPPPAEVWLVWALKDWPSSPKVSVPVPHRLSKITFAFSASAGKVKRIYAAWEVGTNSIFTPEAAVPSFSVTL